MVIKYLNGFVVRLVVGKYCTLLLLYFGIKYLVFTYGIFSILIFLIVFLTVCVYNLYLHLYLYHKCVLILYIYPLPILYILLLYSWLLKWPMQSQKFGRRMRRFFVLRDHILSYHVTRPADEEEVYSNYSLSSLHITENTSIEVGRHMFLRSLIITTPLDKLWIRMQNGNTDEKKWVDSINHSIQDLQRSKLVS